MSAHRMTTHSQTMRDNDDAQSIASVSSTASSSARLHAVMEMEASKKALAFDIEIAKRQNELAKKQSELAKEQTEIDILNATKAAAVAEAKVQAVDQIILEETSRLGTGMVPSCNLTTTENDTTRTDTWVHNYSQESNNEELRNHEDTLMAKSQFSSSHSTASTYPDVRMRYMPPPSQPGPTYTDCANPLSTVRQFSSAPSSMHVSILTGEYDRHIPTNKQSDMPPNISQSDPSQTTYGESENTRTKEPWESVTTPTTRNRYNTAYTGVPMHVPLSSTVTCSETIPKLTANEPPLIYAPHGLGSNIQTSAVQSSETVRQSSRFAPEISAYQSELKLYACPVNSQPYEYEQPHVFPSPPYPPVLQSNVYLPQTHAPPVQLYPAVARPHVSESQLYTSPSVPEASVYQQQPHTFMSDLHTSIPQSYRSLSQPFIQVPRDPTYTRAFPQPESQTQSSSTQDTVSQEDDIKIRLCKRLAQQNLPSCEPDMFDRDVTLYFPWKVSFKAMLESSEISPNQELTYIHNFTTGTARKIVDSFRRRLYTNAQDALKDVWNALDRRFGNAAGITHAHLELLEKAAKFSERNHSKLQEFADVCENVNSQLKYLPGLACLNYANVLHPIVEKMPTFLQTKWEKCVANFAESHQDAYPSFNHFTNLIARQARIKTHPNVEIHKKHVPSELVELHNGDAQTSPRQEQDDDIRVLTLNVSHTIPLHPARVSRRRRYCLYHDSYGHDLTTCIAFGRESIKEKEKILKQYHLCPLCLTGRHEPSDCIQDVTLQHSLEKTQNSCSTFTAIPKIMDVREGSMSCSKVILVDVYSAHHTRSAVRTYAILDDQSNSSLISPDLIKKLGVSGNTEQYSLTTCSSTKKTMSGQKIGGVVARSLGGTCATLPPLIECNQIPQEKDNIATPDMLKRFPHLRSIAGEISDKDEKADIGLLIGRDAPEILKVRAFKNGPVGAPWAQRHSIGWTVSGEFQTSAIDSQTHVIVNKTKLQMMSATPESGQAGSQTFATSSTAAMNEHEDLISMSIAENSRQSKINKHVTKPREPQVLDMKDLDAEIAITSPTVHSDDPMVESRTPALRHKITITRSKPHVAQTGLVKMLPIVIVLLSVITVLVFSAAPTVSYAIEARQNTNKVHSVSQTARSDDRWIHGLHRHRRTPASTPTARSVPYSYRPRWKTDLGKSVEINIQVTLYMCVWIPLCTQLDIMVTLDIELMLSINLYIYLR